MRLKFVVDEAGKRFICRFRLSKRYTGPPGHAHGGIIATILDEVMGKVNKLRNVVAVTAEMTVKYIKPVPLGKPLVAEGRELRVHGRAHTNVGEIRNERGEVLARGKGIFIAIDPHKLFKEHLKVDRNGIGVGMMRPLSAESTLSPQRTRNKA
ncbi:MAG: PaaI family thioesterase [Terriglobales bacterium]